MIKSIVLPNKEYETRKELFSALKKNKDKIIGLKKAAIHKSLPVEFSPNELTKASKDFEEGFIYPVINTTNYQDSHLDIHLKGIWNKSVKEQQGKVHYLVNHDMSVGSVIAYPKDVEMLTKTMSWGEFGKAYQGTTEALIFKTKISSYSNKDAKNIIDQRIPINNSVSMRYVKIEMAINSDDKEFKEEKAIWDKYESEVANKDFFNENGYGFFVSEAEIYREGSMVLAGSNDQTPVIYPKEKGLDELNELHDQVMENPTKENLTYFCEQVKALREGEAVKTLPEIEKPQSNNSLFKHLIQKK